MIGRRASKRIITPWRTAALAAIFAASIGSAARAQQSIVFGNDQRALSAGEILYAARCSECHGADAQGNNGPDLTQLWLTGVSDSRIFEAIRQGVADTVMPPSTAPDEELWAIIAYLRSISTVPPFTANTGDAARGEAYFAVSCADCHLVNGSGGVLGPELSNIAQVRSREALVSAIRNPGEVVASTHRAVTLVQPGGTVLRGIRKGEDAFSIQIVDTDGILRSFLKPDLLQVVEEDSSLMPEFATDELSDNELEDLLAYLSTLRPVPSDGQ
jgi:putative heme-binding domain-containing protein